MADGQVAPPLSKLPADQQQRIKAQLLQGSLQSQIAGRAGAVYVCAHIRGQAAHQRVPTLVGAAVGLGGGLRGLCGLGRRAGRHVGPAGLRGCGGQLSRGVRLGRRLRGGLRGRRLLR